MTIPTTSTVERDGRTGVVGLPPAGWPHRPDEVYVYWSDGHASYERPETLRVVAPPRPVEIVRKRRRKP